MVFSIKVRTLVYALSIVLLLFTAGESQSQEDRIAPPQIVEIVDINNWNKITTLSVGEKSCFIVSGTSQQSMRCFDTGTAISVSETTPGIYSNFAVTRVSIGGEIECLVSTRQEYLPLIRCTNDVHVSSVTE